MGRVWPGSPADADPTGKSSAAPSGLPHPSHPPALVPIQDQSSHPLVRTLLPREPFLTPHSKQESHRDLCCTHSQMRAVRLKRQHPDRSTCRGLGAQHRHQEQRWWMPPGAEVEPGPGLVGGSGLPSRRYVAPDQSPPLPEPRVLSTGHGKSLRWHLHRAWQGLPQSCAGPFSEPLPTAVPSGAACHGWAQETPESQPSLLRPPLAWKLRGLALIHLHGLAPSTGTQPSLGFSSPRSPVPLPLSSWPPTHPSLPASSETLPSGQ